MHTPIRRNPQVTPRSLDPPDVPDNDEMAWAYLLECADGKYYVGSTRDLEARLQQHSSAMIGFTATRRPIKLVWQAELDTVADAYAIERRIHGWSRRKKQALIAGDIDLLRSLSKRRTKSDDGAALRDARLVSCAINSLNNCNGGMLRGKRAARAWDPGVWQVGDRRSSW
ncbi:GIY-YIG nuclease family protein, partial [Gordonia sp. PKS22-38]|nr:GIY-YIG nuclease family protein [Gordonia sp. PKS22-38]